MTNSFYTIGNEHTPSKNKIRRFGEKGWIGNGWTIWSESERYYIEFDISHFMDEFVVIEISKDDYLDFECEKSESKALEIIRRYTN